MWIKYYLFYVNNIDLPQDPRDYYGVIVPETHPLLHFYFSAYICQGVREISEHGSREVQE